MQKVKCACGRAATPGRDQCGRCRKKERNRAKWRQGRPLETRICPECGKSFEALVHGRPRHTCGDAECQRKREVRRERQRRKVARKRPRANPFAGETVLCPVCKRTVSRARTRQVTCLDPECVRRWASNHPTKQSARRVATAASIRDGVRIGKWGLDVDPWAAGTLDAGLLPREISSYLVAEMLPLL